MVLQWRVILLAALAVMTLLAGLVVSLLPDSQEGPILYRLDEQHAVSAIDLLSMILLVIGSLFSWSAGLLWQRRMYAP